MIQKVKNVLKRRKVKLFFLFLSLSALAWFISNLSNRYQSKVVFDLEFVNPPNGMMLLSSSLEQIEVKLDAVGFQFLTFAVGKKKLNIDLSKALRQGSKYMLTSSSIENQIDTQLSNGIKLVSTNIEPLILEFYGVISKTVAVRPELNLQFSQNYLLDGGIATRPDSIVIKGPTNEIDTISYIKTERIQLPDLNADFSITAKLKKPIGLKKTTYSKPEVILYGKVSRFSEKILRVPVLMINLPENTEAQTFPKEVDVLIKASLLELKKVKKEDIKVVGDYKNVKNTGQKTVALRIVRQPKSIHTAELRTNQVDFILKRE